MLMAKDNKVVHALLMIAVLTIGLQVAGLQPASAQKAAPAPSIAGEWDLAMNTPGGVSNLKVLFKVDGEKLSGEVRRSAGTVQLTGTMKGKDLQFSYAVRYNDNDVLVTFTGKVDGDSMNGVVDFNGNAEDVWSAKRAAR